MRRRNTRPKRVRRALEPYKIDRHAVQAAVSPAAFLEIDRLRSEWPDRPQWNDLFWSMARQQLVKQAQKLPDPAAKIMAAKIGAVGALLGLDSSQIAKLVELIDVPEFVAAARSNRSILGFQADPQFKDLWSDDKLRERPPIRAEFQHATVFGTIGEAGDIGKSKTWGTLVSIGPLWPADRLYPRHITYCLRETSKQRMRWEFRDVFKEILGNKRSLVNDAVRNTKREFLRYLDPADARVIESRLELTPTQFWRAVRKGETFGPRGIATFLQRLEERTKGYSLRFDEPCQKLVTISPARVREAEC
jgi:hypothetical protein